MKQCMVIRDAAGDVIGECEGPDARGMCPRVAPGEVVPCAGQVLKADGRGSWLPYAVPAGEALCPLTMALALAASPDALPGLPPVAGTLKSRGLRQVVVAGVELDRRAQ